MEKPDDWMHLPLLRYEVATIRRALSGAAHTLPDGALRYDCAQALGMLVFAQGGVEAPIDTEDEALPNIVQQCPDQPPADTNQEVGS